MHFNAHIKQYKMLQKWYDTLKVILETSSAILVHLKSYHNIERKKHFAEPWICQNLKFGLLPQSLRDHSCRARDQTNQCAYTSTNQDSRPSCECNEK